MIMNTKPKDGMQYKKRWIENVYVIYSILFILIWGVFILFFALRGVSFIHRDDSFNQFFPAFVYVGKYIRDLIGTGRAMQFDFRLGLGDDVIGALNYYGFGDIFSLFSVLIDMKYAEWMFEFIMSLKFYLCGVSFLVYSHKYMHDKYYRTAGAIVYVFSVYALYWGLNFWIFLNPMITLPLILHGVDQIRNNSKKISLCMIIALFVQSLCGFYFLYMEVLVTILYFVIVSIVRWKNREVTWREIGIHTALAVFQGALGVGMGGVLLIPSIIGFLSSTRTDQMASFSSPIYLFVFEDFQQYIDGFANLFMPNAFTSVLTIPLIVLLGAIVLIFGNAGIRQEIKTMAICMVVAFWIPVIGNVMNGFSYWTDRWYFAVLLFLIIAAMAALEDKTILEKRTLIIFEVVVWSSMIVHIFAYERTTEKTVGLIFRIVWFAVLSLLLPYICNRFAMRGRVILICVVIMVTANGLLVFGPDLLGGSGYSWGFKAKGESYKEIRDSVRGIEINEEQFERLDIHDSSFSASLIMDYYGTTEYFSMLNANVSNFYRKMHISPGVRSAATILTGLDGRYELEALLSVTHYMDFGTDEGGKPEAVIRDMVNSLPLGFTYDKYITEEVFNELDPLEKSTVIVNCLVSEKPLDGIDEVTETELGDILNNGQNKEVGITVNESENKIRVYVPEISEGKEYYVRLSDFIIPNDTIEDFYIGNKNIQLRNKASVYYMGEDEFWVHVSEYKKNESGYYFDIVPVKGKQYTIGKIQVYEHVPDRLAVEQRRAYTVEDISIETNSLKGNIKVDSPQAVFLSVPYSSGWRAYVDGKEVDIVRADLAFVSLMLEEGEHEILMVYRTPGLGIGILVSIVSFIALVCIMIISRVHENTKAKRYG